MVDELFNDETVAKSPNLLIQVHFMLQSCLIMPLRQLGWRVIDYAYFVI